MTKIVILLLFVDIDNLFFLNLLLRKPPYDGDEGVGSMGRKGSRFIIDEMSKTLENVVLLDFFFYIIKNNYNYSNELKEEENKFYTRRTLRGTWISRLG